MPDSSFALYWRAGAAYSFSGRRNGTGSKPNLGVITTHVEVYNQQDEVVLTYRSSSLVLRKPLS